MPSAGPDFIGAGFTRCGTTSLYSYLRHHPDLWMPPLKEITYWDLERFQGRRSPKRRNRLRFAASHTVRNPLGWGHRFDDARFLFRYALQRPSDDWYKALFNPARGRVTGDLCPSYMRLPEPEVRDLYSQLPHTKFIFMMRDPFDRAWSNARKALARHQDRTMDQIPDDEIEAYLTAEESLINCDYVTPLRRWRSIVPPDQLFMGFTADLDQRPAELLGRLATFLEIDPDPLIAAERETARQFTTGELGGPIPARWEQLLARHLEPMLADLATDVGGEAIRWHERATRALEEASPNR